MPKTMTRQELRGFFMEMLQETLPEALKPYQEQSTNWMAQLMAQRPPDTAQHDSEKGLLVARAVRSLIAGRGDPIRAAGWAKTRWGENNTVYKALAASDSTAGGWLVPPSWRTEIIELLRPMAVVDA